jgi:D-proline reductase (dithiol) PrdB
LTARTLEEAGIATVVIGSAWDIVNHCMVPRYLHNDLPLGNPLGKPYDSVGQRLSVISALDLAVNAEQPIAVKSDLQWQEDGDESWKDNYMRITEAGLAELKKAGEENRAERLANKSAGLTRAPS